MECLDPPLHLLNETLNARFGMEAVLRSEPDKWLHCAIGLVRVTPPPPPPLMEKAPFYCRRHTTNSFYIFHIKTKHLLREP